MDSGIALVLSGSKPLPEAEQIIIEILDGMPSCKNALMIKYKEYFY